MHMYFDTHAHYDDEQFDTDRDELLRAVHDSGVDLIVDPASNLASSRKVLEIAAAHDFVYCAVGVHPHDAKEMDGDSIALIRDMASNPKVVAIGEIGLDYHYDLSPRDVQRDRFYDQLCLARELHLPVIVHEREAVQDNLDIIRNFKDVLGVVHCFSGSWETAKIILDQGWYISFTGAVTFKNAKKAPEVAAKMPIDRLMIETDSPYMAPVPMRGQRNDSRSLPYIARRIADLRGMTSEDVAAITMENGKHFFRIA
jgi:TatD DNase family protein